MNTEIFVFENTYFNVVFSEKILYVSLMVCVWIFMNSLTVTTIGKFSYQMIV